MFNFRFNFHISTPPKPNLRRVVRVGADRHEELVGLRVLRLDRRRREPDLQEFSAHFTEFVMSFSQLKMQRFFVHPSSEFESRESKVDLKSEGLREEARPCRRRPRRGPRSPRRAGGKRGPLAFHRDFHHQNQRGLFSFCANSEISSFCVS